MSDKFGTVPWYLNVEKIVALLKIRCDDRAKTPGIFHGSDPVFVARKEVQEAIEKHIVEHRVPTLHDLAPDKIVPGKMFTIYNDFYCTGLKGLDVRSILDIPVTREAKIHRKIYIKKSKQTNLIIRYCPRNLTFGSSFIWLAGHQRLFSVAVIMKVSNNSIEATPLLIGSIGDGIMYDGPSWISKESYGRIHISQIDQFSKVIDWMDKNRHVMANRGKIDKEMRKLSEEQTKKGFAEILGEPYVGKDWGGERSDLHTGKLSLDGELKSAAFMFKGPAKFKDLKCSDLGKNGDQIDRLFSEPVEICVLQHCNSISTAVQSQMKAYASRVHDLRNFMIIDGSDTFAILKAYGKI